jgi:PAS domain S-box-containing protein
LEVRVAEDREYRIGELAKLSGLPISTLRLWQRRGYLGGRRSEGGHRLFSDRDLRWVLQARDLTQGRYMTEQVATTVTALAEASDQSVRLAEPIPPRALMHDPNYERMLDLAAQNARLFAEQRELASKLSTLAKELSAAEELYASTVERIPQCLWSAEIDPSGAVELRLCTPPVESITGHPAQFFIEQPYRWLDVVHPLDRDSVTQIALQTLGGQATALEHRILRADGSERWVRNSVTPTLDTSGRVCRVDGLLSDVTERKLAELSLRSSEEKLRLIVENFPDSIFTQDRLLRYTSALNPAFHRADEVLGRTEWDTLSAEDAEMLTRIKRGVIETGKPARTEVKLTLRGDVRYYDTVIRPLRNVSGSIEGVVAYNRDITDRVFGEDALKREVESLRGYELLFSVLADRIQIGALVLDAHGGIAFANERMAVLLGRSRDEMMGLRLQSLVNDDSVDRITDLLERADRGIEIDINLLARGAGRLPAHLIGVWPNREDSQTATWLVLAGES